jgi:uncharacterized membrane protein
LSPQVYLERFNKATRANDDTYVLFCAKLKALLEYYLKSRKIETSTDPSNERLISLLLCDRIKTSLPDHVLKHILAIEATQKDGWLQHDALAMQLICIWRIIGMMAVRKLVQYKIAFVELLYIC